MYNRQIVNLFLIFMVISITALPDTVNSFNNAETKSLKIKSASELDYPPFSIMRSNGTVDGFSVELLKAVVHEIGRDISFEVAPWNKIKQKLIDGDLDVLPLVSYSDERDKVLDFTAPYLRMHGTIFVRKGEKEIRTEVDLKNKEVLVMEGDTAHEYAVNKNLSDKLILTNSFQEAMKLLSSGKHDALIIQQLVGFQLIKKLKISNIVDAGSFREESLKSIAKPLSGFEQKFCFAVPEGNKELLSQLNEGLNILIANNTYNKIYDKWFSPILPQPSVSLATITKYLLFILIPLLFVIGVIGIWYLKKEVKRKTNYLKAEIINREKAQKALHESENRFKLMFERTPLSYQSLDENGNFTEVNQTWLETMGYERDEVLGKNFSKFLIPEWKQHFSQNFPRFKRVGEVLGVEFEMVKKDGSIILVSFHGKIGKNTDGTFKQTHCIFNDVTKQRRLEEEKENMEQKMAQLQKIESIGSLAGGIAHDFNNILFPIVGMSEMLMEDLPEGSQEYESAEEILMAGKRGSELVKQILSFSRQHEHKLIPIRIEKILREVIKLSRSTIPSNIEINEKIQQDCGFVMADSTQMHQVAMNLITNAFHAVEKKNGIIDIEFREIDLNNEVIPDDLLQLGRYVKLSVADNGVGMTQTTIKKVFDPYFTTKEKGKGTGLGLAVVHGIIKEHKGDIKVYSEIGKGTTFSIYLPLVKNAIKTVSVDKISELETGTERILVVDDEESIVKLESEILKRLGYQVTTYSNSKDAFDAFKTDPEKYDLVITDMTMPNMTGDELSKEILSIKPDIPIIICTGFSERVNQERIENIGIKGFLMKPVTKSEMAQMVRKILDESNIYKKN